VVLAGGRGTRFWPLSRRALPKQCLSLDGGPTLLARAIARSGLPASRVLVVTSAEVADAVRAESGGAEVLVEPSGRGTAPAIAWAARAVRARGGDRMVVLPADHVVLDEDAFAGALVAAWAAADAGALVTLGIRPTRPETGFGWIEPDTRDAGNAGESRRVRRFLEKPPLPVAERLLLAGEALWNAGIFVWTLDALEGALAAWLPRTVATLDSVAAGTPLVDAWCDVDAISIDHGVLERAASDGRVAVVPVACGWSDVGAWSALPELLPAGEGGSVLADAVVALRASGNVVHAPGRLVALADVDGLVVVDTPDVLLVTTRASAQAVRDLVAEVERRGWVRYT
jgi:mannose-1-phosphate guanylyltransferase